MSRDHGGDLVRDGPHLCRRGTHERAAVGDQGVDLRAGQAEPAIRGDFAIVKAWKGDRWGNLVYRKTSRNFNPMCAAAGKITVAEVEELVDVGTLDPDNVHTPGIYVQRIFQGTNYEKPIEQRTVRKRT